MIKMKCAKVQKKNVSNVRAKMRVCFHRVLASIEASDETSENVFPDSIRKCQTNRKNVNLSRRKRQTILKSVILFVFC